MQLDHHDHRDNHDHGCTKTKCIVVIERSNCEEMFGKVNIYIARDMDGVILIHSTFFLIFNPIHTISPKRVEDHGEEDELAKEGDDEGGGGDDLGKQEEEHCQGEQDRDG